MSNADHTSKIRLEELIFQLVLNIVVFVFDAFDRKHSNFEAHEVLFFANHAAGALVINYALLSRWLYKKKYWQFFALSALVIVAVMIIEEGVLERIYFPDTRGKFAWNGVFGSGAIYTLLDVLPPIFILCGFKFGWDALRKQNQVDQLTDTIKDSELQFLNSQINPHFLFNNLNNIYSNAINNNPATPQIILDLSEVLRYILYDCKARQVALAREVDHLSNFIHLGQLQIQGRGMIDWEVNGDLTRHRIAPLILIVFIENAIKHSTSSQSEDITIKAALKVDESGMLIFTCQNTFTEESNPLNTGIGLENVKTRLHLLYPEAHQLKFDERDDVFYVQLTIQLNQLQPS